MSIIAYKGYVGYTLIGLGSGEGECGGGEVRHGGARPLPIFSVRRKGIILPRPHPPERKYRSASAMLVKKRQRFGNAKIINLAQGGNNTIPSLRVRSPNPVQGHF